MSNPVNNILRLHSSRDTGTDPISNQGTDVNTPGEPISGLYNAAIALAAQAQAIGTNQQSTTHAVNASSQTLTNDLYNYPMANDPVSISSLKWTIIGSVATMGFGIIGVIAVIAQMSFAASQSVKEETLAKADKIFTQIQSSNDKTIAELQSVRQEMQGMRQDMKQEMVIQQQQQTIERLSNTKR